MKDLDRKMLDRHWQKENERLQKKYDKLLRKEKEAAHERTDKDMQADNDYQHLLELARGR